MTFLLHYPTYLYIYMYDVLILYYTGVQIALE